MRLTDRLKWELDNEYFVVIFVNEKPVWKKFQGNSSKITSVEKNYFEEVLRYLKGVTVGALLKNILKVLQNSQESTYVGVCF